MGVRIDKVESDLHNNTMNVQDTRAEMRTLRTLWNAVTIGMLVTMVTVFIWLDGKIETRFNDADTDQSKKFEHLLTEITRSNDQVNAQIRQINADMTKLTIEAVNINHSLSVIRKEHDER